MTYEEKIYITKIIRRETSCGLKEASDTIDKLIEALKHKPLYIMDNPSVIECVWKKIN
jgi:hypothetical protein